MTYQRNETPEPLASEEKNEALFTFIAEASSGAIIKESMVSAHSHAVAYHMFWASLTDAERDACSCIECLDVIEE